MGETNKTKEQIAKDYCREGNRAFSNKQYETAIDYYQQAIESKPDYAEAYLFLGKTYWIWYKKYEEAIKFFQKAVDCKPDYAEAYCLMGQTYKIWDKLYDKEIECYQKAIACKPDFVDAYFHLGKAYENVKNDEFAMIYMKQAAQLGSKNATRWLSKVDDGNIRPSIRSIFDEGRNALKQKQYELALECFQKVITLKPDLAEAYFTLGSIYGIWRQDYKQALEYYQKAIELKPDYAEAYFNLGVAYGLTGNTQQGIDYMKQAAQLGNEPAKKWLKANSIK
ncbi:MAG: tetratricopeptide repeat protein [Bacteroidales bacterium]|nr:tetratricopeptide repeat protein [Bacteroidales bacterium]